ncbi:IclR family transcriptional regulator [Nocardioides sp. YJ-D4]
MLQTIQKIGPVLDLFTCEQPEWGVSEVANAIGAPRSSAHSLLASLVDTGLLQCRGRGRYRIGWRVVEMGQTLRASTDVRSAAADSLQSLNETFGETVHLAVMDRYMTLYVDKISGTHVINVMGARVGSHVDMHCTAIGKVLLASCEPEEIDRFVLSKPLRRLTPATITNPAALVRELDHVRSTGVAFDAGEAVTEVHCVAAPVRDDLGTVVAAISMSVPVSRFAPNKIELRKAVCATAAEITRKLARPRNNPVTVVRDDPSVGLASLAG